MSKLSFKKTERPPLRIAFFIGEDVVSLVVGQEIIRFLQNFEKKNVGSASPIYSRIIPDVFFVKTPDRINSKDESLRTYAFLESKCLTENIFPFINAKPTTAGTIVTPEQLIEDYGLSVRYIEDVNSPELLQYFQSCDPNTIGISIRCLRKFGDDIINAFDRMLGLVNIHPGPLPTAKGLCSTFWCVAEGLDSAKTSPAMSATATLGATAHRIRAGQGIDQGPILHRDPHIVDLGARSFNIFNANLEVVGLSKMLPMLISLLGSVISGTHDLSGYDQDPSAGTYHSVPTSSEVAYWRSLGMIFARKDLWKHSLIRLFSQAGSPHAARMDEVLEDAWNRHVNPDNPFFQNGPSPRINRPRARRGRSPDTPVPTHTTGGNGNGLLGLILPI